MNKFFTFAFLALFTVACGTGGTPTSTTPVSTNAAQTVGNDQGSAQATETVSATNNNTPTIVNILAAKKVTMDGGKIEVEGSDDAEVSIGAATFGTQSFGDEGLRAEAGSGGGAAGSTGADAGIEK